MDWSYIAGYFDGEGHVGLHKQTGRRGKVTTLSWYNSHLGSLKAMRDFMETGYIGLSRGGGKGSFEGSKKIVYVLRISRKIQLIRIIDAMLPHLIIKHDAALALREHLVEHVNEKRAANFGVLLAVPKTDYERWYLVERQSLAMIATHLHATPAGVLRLFKLHGIPLRPAGGSHLKGIPKSPETIARMKAARAKLWADPEYASRMRGQLIQGHKAPRKKGYAQPNNQGEKHHGSKLSNQQTAAIRQKYAAGGLSLMSLAVEYSVSKKTILNIIHGKIRKDSLAVVSEPIELSSS